MESGRLKQLGKGYTSTTPDLLLAQGLRINRVVHHRHSGECRNPENVIGVTQLNTISQAENHTVPVQNYPQLRKSYVSVMLRYSVNSAS
jgi:hypothetical protein